MAGILNILQKGGPNIEKLINVQGLMAKILNIINVGRQPKQNIEKLINVQGLMDGILNILQKGGPNIEKLINVQGLMAGILNVFLIVAPVIGSKMLESILNVQQEIQIIIWILEGKTQQEIDALIPSGVSHKIGEIAKSSSGLWDSTMDLYKKDYLQYGNVGNLIKNIDEYSDQLDDLYNFVEEYKFTKDKFLDTIASASSYLLKTILLGSNAEYTKLRKNLSSTPESMVHSFETVLEREASVNENNLPENILKILGSNKGVPLKQITESKRELSQIVDSYYNNNMGSDHCPIVAKLPYNKTQDGGYTKNTYDTYDTLTWNKIGYMYVNENKKLGGCRKI
jgi:hypothetical protein